MKISHSNKGWKATDDQGSVGTSTFAEGKQVAIDRCKKVGKETTKVQDKRTEVGKDKG